MRWINRPIQFEKTHDFVRCNEYTVEVMVCTKCGVYLMERVGAGAKFSYAAYDEYEAGDGLRKCISQIQPVSCDEFIMISALE